MVWGSEQIAVGDQIGLAHRGEQLASGLGHCFDHKPPGPGFGDHLDDGTAPNLTGALAGVAGQDAGHGLPCGRLLATNGLAG